MKVEEGIQTSVMWIAPQSSMLVLTNYDTGLPLVIMSDKIVGIEPEIRGGTIQKKERFEVTMIQTVSGTYYVQEKFRAVLGLLRGDGR